ncbi:MAG TPA: Flp family type IVb pilin [Rhizomicrobium sp.]|nr:Flp family type IVb pilin [Rhizomicrobium sp.]
MRRFAAETGGATAIEYGLLAALMSMAIIAAFTNMGTTVNTTFVNIASALR